MAAASPMQGLKEEAKCSICLDYYKDPVTTKCSHNFCRACITRCGMRTGTALSCPQCRESCRLRDLRPNRQLHSMVEFVKLLSVQWERLPGEGLCEKHVQKLNLFCVEDLKLICVNCRESMEHKTHNVRPLEEAAQEYKSKLLNWLPTLRTEMDHFTHMKLKAEEDYGALRSKLLDWLPILKAEMDHFSHMKLKAEEDCSTLRKKLDAERINIVTEFEILKQLLKKQEQTLLERLEEMEKKLTTVENAKRAKLCAELSSLEDLITEIEKKCEQPAELLKEFRSTLSRCEHVQLQTLEGIRKKYKEHVALDADTAHARLALFEAGRRVTNTGIDQTPPAHSKRFTGYYSVLGEGGFTSGRRYWELEVLRDQGWRLGVAHESVSRGGGFIHSPEEGVWAVEHHNNQYMAHTATSTPLTPALPPRKLGVYLDYEGGRVSVYNASTMEELYTFSGVPFRGPICPYFSLFGSLVEGTDLRLV